MAGITISLTISRRNTTVSLHAEALGEWFELHHIAVQLQYGGRLF